jgi:hypothetical protein
VKLLHAKLIISFSLIALLVSACGYKPSSKISRGVLGDKISTSITISAIDPENTVILKDAVDSAIVEVFHSSLVSRELSDTHLELAITDPSYSPIQYDQDGYVVGYRMTLILNINSYHNGVEKKYTASGSYDFSVTPNAVLTDQERFNAIKLSASKAIKSFMSQVAVLGVKK